MSRFGFSRFAKINNNHEKSSFFLFQFIIDDGSRVDRTYHSNMISQQLCPRELLFLAALRDEDECKGYF